MSVSIHPAGLYDPNSPLNEGDVRWRHEEYSCLCVEFNDDEKPDKHCHYCGGKGVIVRKSPPIGWEANLANGNFSTIGNAIGFLDDPEDMWGGSIHPQKLIDLLDAFDPSLGVRGGSDTQEEGKCRIIDCGCSPEQVDRYTRGLRLIAYVALSRGVDVEWG